MKSPRLILFSAILILILAVCVEGVGWITLGLSQRQWPSLSQVHAQKEQITLGEKAEQYANRQASLEILHPYLGFTYNQESSSKAKDFQRHHNPHQLSGLY